MLYDDKSISIDGPTELATGSEVSVAIAASDLLARDGIRGAVGALAPGEALFAYFGITPEKVAEAARALL